MDGAINLSFSAENSRIQGCPMELIAVGSSREKCVLFTIVYNYGICYYKMLSWQRAQLEKLIERSICQELLAIIVKHGAFVYRGSLPLVTKYWGYKSGVLFPTLLVTFPGTRLFINIYVCF